LLPSDVGVNITQNIETINNDKPHIIVGTPGRILDLATKRKVLDLSKVKHFVLDECDRMLSELDMRKDVQTIFRSTPHEKQVMMYSATLDKEIRPVCRKFCQDVRSLPRNCYQFIISTVYCHFIATLFYVIDFIELFSPFMMPYSLWRSLLMMIPS